MGNRYLFLFLYLTMKIPAIDSASFSNLCDETLKAIENKDLRILQGLFAPEIIIASVDAPDPYSVKNKYHGFLQKKGEVYESFFSEQGMPNHGFPSIYDMVKNRYKVNKFYKGHKIDSGFAILSKVKGKELILNIQFTCGNKDQCRIKWLSVDNWSE